MEIYNDVIKQLEMSANVRVSIDVVPNMYKNAIVINRTKMLEMVNSYGSMYSLVHRCWSNLPEPPCSEKTYLFMWMIASEGYSLNHNSISWEGSNPNTFVHLWSIIDRIRIALENTRMSWIVGERNCVDYCKTTGMTGPMDQHLYERERITPTEIEKMETDMTQFIFEDVRQEFCSFYDFQISTMMPENEHRISTSEMELRNQEFIRKSGRRP